MAALRVSVLPLSSCPAAGLVWRRGAGPWTLTVVARATFVLRPGLAALSTVQHLPVAGPRGSPNGSGGVYAPTDLVPAKPHADVIVVGPARSPDARLRLAIAQLDKRGVAADVASFGPVAAAATTRDWGGKILPPDLDPARFNVAPLDQQLAAIRGDERVLLEGLHPEHAELVTALPGLRAVALAEGPGGPPRRVAMRADTLWIDASRGLCAIVWRGQTTVDRDLRVLVDVDGAERAEQATPITRGTRHEASSAAAPPPPSAPLVAEAPAWVVTAAAPAGIMLPLAARADEVSPWARGTPVALSPRVASLLVALPITLEPEPRALADEPPAGAPGLERPRETLDLVWMDPTSAARARREPHFAEVFDAIDDRIEAPLNLDELDAGELADREERRDVFELLATAEPEREDGAAAALDSALVTGGALVEPVVLVAGELAVVFDPKETLKAVCSAAERLAGADAATTRLVAEARRFLRAPGAAFAPTVAIALADRVRSAAVASLSGTQRQAAAGELDVDVRRGLLDARAFAWSRAFGAKHARAVVRVGERRYDTFLAEDLAKALPRAERIRARMLAMVHPHVSTLDERTTAALRPIALAVVVTG